MSGAATGGELPAAACDWAGMKLISMGNGREATAFG